jgi:phosphoglycolate phosphatase
MKKGILFDLDGTLWDSSAEVTEAWNQAILRQGRTEQFTVADMHNFMGRTLEAIAAMMFPAEPQPEQIRLILACEENEYKYLRAHKAHIYSREEEILRALSQEYALGIVSNCQDGYIDIYLDQCGFPQLFCDHECAGVTGLSKGQNIRLVMERQGIERCVYLGDTQGDADAAKEAGIPFIHAGYGFGKVDAADAVISDIMELPGAAAAILGDMR